ncbi:MAG: autotransporter-associated beta strand repeat-containing protein [Luminiphilus sp.]|nr:autotransporter-associated beta strand repeat-containing protein [Luminiphilus sp.]
MKSYNFVRAVVIPTAVMMGSAGAVHAADGTWIGGNGLWSSGVNWSAGGIADGSGFTADFSTLDIAVDTTVSLDSLQTIGYLTFGDTDTATAAGWILDNGGTPGYLLTLAGAAPTITVNALGAGKGATISADVEIPGIISENSPALLISGGNLDLSGTVTADDSVGSKGYVSLNEGTTVTVSGRLLHHTTATQSTKMYVGDSSANNTLNVSGHIRGDALYVGSSTFGGNTVNVTGPATALDPTIEFSGKNNDFKIGVSSSNNSVNFSNGSYSIIKKGSGAPSMPIGELAGANGNSLTVDGAGTIVDAYMELYVGKAGDNNTFTVSNGGVYENQYRSFVGETGSNNTALVTGANSYFAMRLTTTNVKFGVGTGVGATLNSFTVADGASALIGAGRSDRELGIGWVTGADSNRVRVTGTDSLLTISHVNALSIGGKYQNDIAADSSATGNHLDVYSGATADLKTVYLQGVLSAFNLGDGTGISTATVGQSSGSAVMGVILSNADSVLTIDSGRLIGSLDGPLVSGLGDVALLGPAYIRTDWTSEISSAISGVGSLTKEGSGALTLSGANSYSGGTTVDAGTLIISDGYLADASDVSLTAGAIFDLAFTGTDTIDELFFNGAPQAIGTWGALGSGADHPSAFFTGAGMLNVTKLDAFPLDPVESKDTDGDGIGDNGDAGGTGIGISLVGVPLACHFNGPVTANTTNPAGAPGTPLSIELSFQIDDCGSLVQVQAKFGETIPAGSMAYKRSLAGVWTEIPGAVISGNTITYSIEDGGPLDADGTVNGSISDPVTSVVPTAPTAPAAEPATPVPLAPLWLLGMMAGLLSVFGARKLRSA